VTQPLTIALSDVRNLVRHDGLIMKIGPALLSFDGTVLELFPGSAPSCRWILHHLGDPWLGDERGRVKLVVCAAPGHRLFEARLVPDEHAPAQQLCLAVSAARR
jgi:hypothetical protein